MGRPFSVSDEQIFEAANRVISSRGPDAFSLAEVASEVGLSRAAIILRFKSTQGLKVTLLMRQVEQFAAALAALPSAPSGDNLLQIAAFVGSYTNGRDSSARFFFNYSVNLRDPQLMELERKRGELLSQAISKVMPEVAVDHAVAVRAFRNHLTGCVLDWLSLEIADPRGFLVLQTREWLKLAGISFNKHTVRMLAGSVNNSRDPGANASQVQSVGANRTRRRTAS